MKALSLWQPWAWAVIHGPKRIENRGWYTSHRGELVIHAAKTRKGLECELSKILPGAPPADRFTLGALVGIVRVVGCVPFREVDEQPFAEGPWCWLLEDPRPFPEPIPYRGAQGFFEVPNDLIGLPTRNPQPRLF